MRWTAAERAAIFARYHHGESAGEIAKDYPGRSRNAVLGVIQRETAKARKAQKPVRGQPGALRTFGESGAP